MTDRIFPAIALITALGIFIFYIQPTWTGSIATLKADIAADDTAIASANQYDAQQNQLSAARDAIDPNDIARLTTFLPDSVDNVGLVLDLNALATRSQLSLSNVVVNSSTASSQGGAAQSALPAGGNSPIGSIELSLSATGTFAALQQFIVGVEKSARILDVRDLVVKGSNTGIYTYQIRLRLYWLH